MFYRKAERGHIKSSLCLHLTVLKVEMKERKLFYYLLQEWGEERGQQMSSLVDSYTVKGDQPNHYVYLRMYSGEGRGQGDRRGETHLNLPLYP